MNKIIKISLELFKNYRFYYITAITVLCLFAFSCAEQTSECPEHVKKECHAADKKHCVDIPDALTVIHQRSSVRQYSDKDATKEQLEILLKAGMAAPTAGNRQPWHLIAIKDKDLMEYMTEYLPFGQMLDHAAAAIVVCGDLSKVNVDGPEYWVQDCSAVTQNILLAVEAIGLGAVWIGVYPAEERTNDMINVLDLDENIIPLSVISIGYPAQEPEPKEKWDPEKVTWIL